MRIKADLNFQFLVIIQLNLQNTVDTNLQLLDGPLVSLPSGELLATRSICGPCFYSISREYYTLTSETPALTLRSI